jgi:tetratricopeptide (TPR) repeat protein
MDQIKFCYNNELYDSVLFLVPLFISETIQLSDKIECLTLMGDSLFKLCEYRRAMKYYEMALAQGNFRKSPLYGGLKFKFARSCYFAKEFVLGKNTILSLPQENLNSLPILMLLAKFYEETGENFKALSVYKNILLIVPFSVEAMKPLIKAHEKVNIPQSIPDYLSQYFESLIHSSNFDYQKSRILLEGLHSRFPSSVEITLELALVTLRLCLPVPSSYLFEKARALDPDTLLYMDKYSALLKSQNRFIELNKLSRELIRSCETRPESWVSLARYFESKGNKDKSLLYLEKALYLNKSHAEAYLLRATISVSNGNAREALTYYRKAHRIDPDIYTYEGIIDASLIAEQKKEVLAIAKEMTKMMPNHPRALTAIGIFFQRYGDLNRAKRAFLHALEVDSSSIEALLALVSLYCSQEKYTVAISQYLK